MQYDCFTWNVTRTVHFPLRSVDLSRFGRPPRFRGSFDKDIPSSPSSNPVLIVVIGLDDVLVAADCAFAGWACCTGDPLALAGVCFSASDELCAPSFDSIAVFVEFGRFLIK